MDNKIYRDDVKLSDMITVQLPAGLIVAAVSVYAEAEWSSSSVSSLLIRCQEQVMDQQYWNEQQAAHQEAHDQAEAMRQQVMSQWLPHIMPHDPRLDEQ